MDSETSFFDSIATFEKKGMEKINEVFEYLEKNSDDDIRYQLIDYMKTIYHELALAKGTARPTNRYKLRLRRLANTLNNLTDLIKFCFENNLNKVIEELESVQKQPKEKPAGYFTVQTLHEEYGISESNIRNAMKVGRLKFYNVAGTGKINIRARFTPEHVEEFLKRK